MRLSLSLHPQNSVIPRRVLAQASPPFVVQGPTIVQGPGCTLFPENFGGGKLTNDCVSISYDQNQPTSASIAQHRYVLVPRGNLLFEFPLVCNLVGKQPSLNVDYDVTVTATGPNGEIASAEGSVELHGKGSAMLQVPINVDWAESSVTFRI
jgi:hypothetical protein